MRKNLWGWSLWSLLGLWLSACTVPIGFGPALDLQAPNLAILTPKNLDYVPNGFTVQGTCDDNIQVTSVSLEISPPVANLPAVILATDRKSWSIGPINLPSEGEYQLKFNAHDKANNSSATSVSIINITFDKTSPSTIVSLPPPQSKIQLEARLTKSFDNMDYLKNGEFILKGNLDDNFRINSTDIDLLDTANTVVFHQHLSPNDFIAGSTPPAGVDGTLYSWSIHIKTVNLTSLGLPLDPATRYYFKIRITTEDKAGLKDYYQPLDDTKPGWICVWGNADLPWSQTTSVADGGNVTPGGYLSGNAYDDDGIAKAGFAIRLATDPAPALTDFATWTTAGNTAVFDTTATRPRLYPWQVQVPSTSGVYKLYTLIQDLNGATETAYEVFNFIVPDLSAPITVVSSPAPQSVTPASGTGNFTLTGYSYDNDSVKAVKMAWVPEGQDAGVLTTKNPDGTTVWDQAVGATPYLQAGTNIKVWNLTPSLVNGGFDATLPTDDGNPLTGRYRWNWTRTLNVETDFSIGGTPAYTDHRLYFYTVDNTGQTTIDSLPLLKPTTAPTITITSPAADGTAARSLPGDYFGFAGNFTTNGLVSAITVRWAASGVSLPASLTSTFDPVTGKTSGTWSLSSSGFNLTSGPQNFEVLATDVYGNKTYATRYVQVDNSGATVLNVSSSNKTYKEGETIKIVVDFSKNVTVTGLPQLQLNTTPPRTADFSAAQTGALPSSRLAFLYTVQPGDTTTGTAVLDASQFVTSSGNTVADTLGNLVASTSLPSGATAGSLAANQVIYVDGVTVSQTTSVNVGIVNSNDLVPYAFVLDFSKKVVKDTGTITLSRKNKTFPVLLTPTQFNDFSNRSGSDPALLAGAYNLNVNGFVNGATSTTPVYVLNYAIDPIFSPTLIASPATTAEKLLNLFDNLGYNDLVIDLYSSQVVLDPSGLKCTITPSGGLPLGIDYTLTITGYAFKDAVSHYLGVLNYNFSTWGWTDAGKTVSYNVASPVFRVNKISKNVPADTNPTTTTFKLTSETANAKLYYTSSDNLGNAALVAATTPTKTSTGYTSAVTMGTGPGPGTGDTLGEIVDLKAIAYDASNTVWSRVSNERAYKTVLISSAAAPGADTIWFRGSNNSGGPTTAAGFPLRWEDDQLAYVKPATGTAWMTWEISVPVQFKPIDVPAFDSYGPTSWHWASGVNGSTAPGTAKTFAVSTWDGTNYTRTTTPLPALTFNPSTTAIQINTNLTVTSPTTGATIYYTTDGSTPTTLSASATTSLSIVVNPGTTLKAFSSKVGSIDSAIQSVTYTQAKVATPTASVVPGAVALGTSVTLATTTTGATIYYTTDGTVPTTSHFSGTFTTTGNLLINANTTIQAMASLAGDDPSDYLTATYTIAQVSAPAISASGQVAYGSTFTLTSSTAGASIYYTTDGSTPTTASPLYSTALTVTTNNLTIKTYAVKTGFLDSSVSTGTLTLPVYLKTRLIDGTDDFSATYEKFTAPNGSDYAHVAWDATYIYVSMSAAELSSGSGSEWLHCYIGGATNGSNISYSGVVANFATMPTFKPSYYVRFKTDGTFSNVRYAIDTTNWGNLSYASWTDGSGNLTAGNYYKNGGYIEFRIPRTAIGSPSTLRLTMFMLDEGTTKKLFNAIPSASFGDVNSGAGTINLTKYLEFDLSSTSPPNVQAQLKS